MVPSYRREEATPALSHLLAQLDRQRLAEEIVLAPLGREEVGTLLQAIFDLKQPVRAEFLDAIFALTEGNPFFVEEVLKSLIAAGDIFYADGIWDRKPLEALRIPRSVQDAVQRRADRLSDPARQLLSLAAVAGRRFDFRLLQALTGHGEEHLLALIKELLAAQLVVEESADRFAFRHALTREAISVDLLARERRALHQRIGAMLEQQHADALGAYAVELATHFYAAGDWVRVLRYNQWAGEQAQARYAPRAAVAHLTRALEAAERLGLVPSPALFRARGQAHESLGSLDEQRADFERALASAQALGDQAAEWQALLDLGMLWAARDYRQTRDYLHHALALARTMDDRAALAHSLNRLGNWLMNMEQPLEALSHHREALAIFEALGDRCGLATTLDLLGTSFYGSGDAFAGALAYQQAAALFRELDDRAGLVSTLGMLAFRAGCAINDASAAVPGSQTDGLREAEEALALARETGHRPGELFALVVLVYRLSAQGHYDRVLSLAEKALALAVEIGHHHLLLFAHLAAGALALDLLDGTTAQCHLEQALALARRGGSPYWTRISASLLAPALHLQGDLPAAVELLDGLLP
ncbi:MAG: tetratricopeptide repeat protein [Ardenticatenaceae bacterium]|nr:tetratricopeptide repeat protein [Ardenticatenaceae bacterium]